MKTSIDTHNHETGEFDMLVSAMQRRFATITALGQTPLFTCDAPDLYKIYLDGFGHPEDRQHHTCHCCRQFIERLGNLVVIDPETGDHKSAIWPDHQVGVPMLFDLALRQMTSAIRAAKVDGVFIAKETVWGTPQAGGFSHFHLTVPASYVKVNRYLEPHQVMAQKKQDFGTLSHGLSDFKIDTIKTAMSLLKSDSLYRSEKIMGPVQFLHDLQVKLASTKNAKLRKHMIWHAVAIAPVGFATPRSSMAGTLMEDIAAGMDFTSVSRRFAAKMDPLQYQRPQVAASSGNIAQAEKVVEKLGIANSLKRRYARFDEMRLLWEPSATEKPKAADGGIFSHLKKQTPHVGGLTASAGKITWSKFQKDVLPAANKIELYIEPVMNFVGVMTATDPNAPPILQWDNPEKRNPVSWYVYSKGSRASMWNLVAGKWVEVDGISKKPCLWDEPEKFSRFGDGIILITKGAEDQHKSGLSLFPECLISDLHNVRSTIESFSRTGIVDEGQPSANGLLLGKDMNPVSVRVKTDFGITTYIIDRLE